MSPSQSVVFIPGDIECDDGLYARQGVAHIERRGNKFIGVMRDWGHVLRLAAEGVVVVFAKREHCPPATQVRREFVGEETCRLIPIVQEAAGHRPDLPIPRPVGRLHGRAAPFDESPTVVIFDRRRVLKNQSRPGLDNAARPGAANWSKDRVREVVDGNGPIPAGLDQESVAAARRIARHLAPRWNR